MVLKSLETFLNRFNFPTLLRFSKTRELWNSKANWRLRFSLPSIILADHLENKTLLQRVQKVMYGICHWWISISFGWFCVSRFVACDRNYDWRQRKTQLWGRLLNFRVRMFVKSAVMRWKPKLLEILLRPSHTNVWLSKTWRLLSLT